MRAFDLDKKQFRAYALTRICSVDIDRQAKESPNLKLKDFQWSRMVSLELIPHPNRKNVPHPGVLGIFRPKTTKCSGGPAICGLQRGITFR